jgi:hypothetical protein
MDPKPNILLVASGRQHYGTLGAVNPRIRTPALDRLGLAASTLVVSCDHGHFLGRRGLYQKLGMVEDDSVR